MMGHWLCREILLRAVFVVLLLAASWHGAYAAEPSLGSGGKWVLVDTKVGKGWQYSCDTGRCKGSLLSWSVSKTSITYRNRQVDNGIDYSDATFVFTLPEPPAELYQGKKSLVFAGEGSGYIKGGYWGTRLDILEDDYVAAELYIDTPDRKSANPSNDTLKFELDVPKGSRGREFKFGVFLNAPRVDGCRSCPTVEWTYRFEEVPVALGDPGQCSDLEDDPTGPDVNQALETFGIPPIHPASKLNVVAQFVGVYGDVHVRRKGSDKFKPAVKGLLILLGDEIRTGEGGLARVQFADRIADKDAGPSIVNIGRGTTFCVNHYLVQLTAGQRQRRGFVELIRGKIRGYAKGWGQSSGFDVRAGPAVLGIRGSDFLIFYEPRLETLQAYLSEGSMVVTNTRTGETKQLGAAHKVAMDHGRFGVVMQLSRSEWESGIAEVSIDKIEDATGSDIQKGCRDLAGSWEQTSGNSGTSTWTITGPPGGPYHAVEHGLGQARGSATYDGKTLRIDWDAGTWSGIYAWTLGPDCVDGRGTLTFDAGSRAGETDTSKVVRR